MTVRFFGRYRVGWKRLVTSPSGPARVLFLFKVLSAYWCMEWLNWMGKWVRACSMDKT